MPVEYALYAGFTFGPAFGWGVYLGLRGFKPLEDAGSNGNKGRIFLTALTVLCVPFLSSFLTASREYVMTGSRLLLALTVLSFVAFFVGAVIGTMWRTVPTK